MRTITISEWESADWRAGSSSERNLEKRDSLSHRTHVSCVPNHGHRSADSDPFKESLGEVSRHPHAAVRCGVTRKIAGMHAKRLTELHVEWHRGGSVMEAGCYVTARSSTSVYDVA